MAEVFNLRDPHAKRCVRKFKEIGFTKLHAKFKKKYPKYNELPTNTFKAIIGNFSEYLIKQTIEHRDGVELPEGLGYIMITSFKTTKQLIDKAESQRLGIKVYHKNHATDGFMMKIFYTNDKMKYKLENRYLWSFKARNEFRQVASHQFTDNWKNYIQLNWIKKMCRIVGTDSSRTPLLSDEEMYNEFDI